MRATLKGKGLSHRRTLFHAEEVAPSGVSMKAMLDADAHPSPGGGGAGGKSPEPWPQLCSVPVVSLALAAMWPPPSAHPVTHTFP